MEDLFYPESDLHNPTLDISDSSKKEKVSLFTIFASVLHHLNFLILQI